MDHDRVVLEMTSPPGDLPELQAYAARRGFRRLLLGPPPASSDRRKVLRTVRAPGPSGNACEIWTVAGERLRQVAGPPRVVSDRTAPPPRGVVRRVGSPSDLPSAVGDLVTHPVVLVQFVGDRLIPLENLIAMRQQGRVGVPPTRRGGGPRAGHEGHQLWVRAVGPEQVHGLLGALEHGADAVVVPVSGAADIDRLEALLDRPQGRVRWTWATVTHVDPGGVGERVAVDTTSLLRPDEGLLVGSQGAFLFLVISEAIGSAYTRARPFRVNAGAVHAYVLLADGTTRYLSELEPGDRLLAVRTSGEARSVRVGRLKIERRPFALVRGVAGGRRVTLFAQEAETVRLSSRRGPVAVPSLRAGTRVRGRALPPARHFGMAVEESVEER